MPNRRSSPEHDEAVARRLALLNAELAGRRPAAPPPPPPPPPLPSPGTPPGTPAAAPGVPVPGRHAARRPGRPGVVSALAPTTLRGRVLIGPAQLTVVALVVTLGLGVTCWWLVRGDAQRLEAPTLRPSTAALSTQSPLSDASPVAASASPGASGAPSVTVDVAGKVRRPGIVVLDAGARVVDALEAAGGARPGVDLSSLNLARVLVDGEQVVVGQPAPVGVAASAVPPAGAPAGPLVNLNSATQAELETLPEVGPVTAQAIVSWREEHGGFTAVDELLEVDGIGDATLGQLAPYVTV
ncbi:MAG TPA: ComEA family DNA-binding protein [Nocardioides sp.]|nr:ComEA family DNA-binding protein [Nocardioides sp.]